MASNVSSDEAIVVHPYATWCGCMACHQTENSQGIYITDPASGDGADVQLPWLRDDDAPGPQSFAEFLKKRFFDTDVEDLSPAAQTATTGETNVDTNTGDADQAVDGLLHVYRWDTTTLTYSFPNATSDFEASVYNHPQYGNGEINSFQALSGTQQNAARAALDAVEGFSGLSLTEVSGPNEIDADLRFGMSDAPNTAWAYLPFDGTTDPRMGDVWFNKSDFNTPVIGNYAYATFLHETGHAIGLKHAHESGDLDYAGTINDVTGAGAVPYDMDSMEFTIMTYRSWIGKPLNYGYANEEWGFAQSYMMLDIAALQELFGADFTFNGGDTTYTFSTATGEMFVNGAGAGTPGGNRIFRTIWDGDGTDTYDLSNYVTNLIVDLAPGGFVDLDAGGNFQRAQLETGFGGNPVTYARGHIFNAMQFNGDARSLIENAIGGSGNDVLHGNAADNVLTGGSGNDTFHDSAGDDTYIGGIGGADLVVMAGDYADYTLSLVGEFVGLAFGAFVDLISDSVENVQFADQTVSYATLSDEAGGGGGGGGGNQPPTGVDDAYGGTEDTVLTVSAAQGVLDNDSDPENGQLSARVLTDVTHGSLTLETDGSFTYTPDADFFGTDSFTYTVTDAGGASDTADVTITVDPALTSQAVLIDFEQLPTGGLSETEGLSFSGLSVSSGSRLDGNRYGSTSWDGRVEISADEDFAFNSFDVTRAWGGSSTVSVRGYRDGEEVAAQNVGGVRSGRKTEVALNDDFDSVDRVVIDGPWFMSVDDLDLEIFTVPAEPNDPPTGEDDSYAVNEDGTLDVDQVNGVLDNDSDPENTQLSAALLVGVAHGSLTLETDGAFTYTPDADFFGTDSFTYTVTDAGGATDTASVTLTVNPVNDAPEANDDTYATGVDEALNIAAAEGVLENDTDIDGPGLSVSVLDDVENGALSLGGDGSFIYTPGDGFSGTDSFTYVVTDGSASDTASVTIAVNAAPTSQEVLIDFEQLPTGGVNELDGFSFSGLSISSGSQLDGNRYGSTSWDGRVEISANEDFAFNSFDVTRAFGGSSTVTVRGYRDGEEVAAQNVGGVRSGRKTEVALNDDFDSVDRVVIDGPWFTSVDDLSFEVFV